LLSAALGAVVILTGACAGTQDKQPAALPVSPLETRPAPAEPPPVAGAAGDSAGSDAAAQPAPIAGKYRDAAARILAAATADHRAYEKLAYLTDRVGHRLSGSAGMQQAVIWALRVMREEGHENVRAQKVMVPHWVRGQESAAILAPVARPIAILGLGNSVGTGPKGITGEVVVVKDFAALEALGAQVAGKIVLYDKRMEPYTAERGSGYGEASPYRVNGAARAAKLGARAVLVRSLTAHSLRTPHTGAMRYEEKVPQIPAAAVSIEDAELIARLAAAGETVKVRLTMGARMLPDAESANVIAELVGREKPEEIVVIGAHLDSWDVGQGAHDDGAGCVMMMHALTLLRELGLKPRRTIRVVLFTNEENGLRGGIGYAQDHAAELPNHVMAMEADSGGFAPRGISVEGNEQAVAQVRDLIQLLAPLGATEVDTGHSGADLIPLVRAGVQSLGLMVEGSQYFHYHHTDADTLDKVVPEDLARNVAAVATVAYVIADMPERFGQVQADAAGAAPAAAP
jgi:Zn-dependent M28 family amino/carboxypeptidase